MVSVRLKLNSNWRSFMKSNTLASAVRVLSVLLLVSGTCAFAEGRPVHFTGLINDYSPLDPTIKGSPYEMHGQWSMDVNPEKGTADFSADMTMSDYGTDSRCCRSDEGRCRRSHTPHRVDER